MPRRNGQSILGSLKTLAAVQRGAEQVVLGNIPADVEGKNLDVGDQAEATYHCLFTVPFREIAGPDNPDLTKSQSTTEWARRNIGDPEVVERLINAEFIKRRESTTVRVRSATLLGADNITLELFSTKHSARAIYAARRHAGVRQSEQRDGSFAVRRGTHPNLWAHVVSARVLVRQEVIQNFAITLKMLILVIASALIVGISFGIAARQREGGNAFEVLADGIKTLIKAVFSGAVGGLGLDPFTIGMLIVGFVSLWLILGRRTSSG